MARTIFVGDVHGCRDELADLLDRVAFAGGDRLVMVGDLLVRGPDPRGLLDLLRASGARSVRGNHEERLLGWRRDPARAVVGDVTLATAKALRPRDWAFIDALPLWLDVPEHGIRVVHAGVVPRLPIEQTPPRALMNMRCLDPAGSPLERRDGPLWGSLWRGPPHVVFGHNAMEGLQLHPWATGLDTACVYGEALTAMVLNDGEAPPPPGERRSRLVSVRARKRYWPR